MCNVPMPEDAFADENPFAPEAVFSDAFTADEVARAARVSRREIDALIDSGDLRPIVDQTYPFDEAPQALAHVEGGRAKGKVVITMV